MSAPFEWVKLISLYGPFSLLVFFVFVVEYKIRKSYKQEKGDYKKIYMGLYLINWVIIFILAYYSIDVWKTLNLEKKYVIEGTFENLKHSEIVTSRNEFIYFRRRYDIKNNFDYDWRIISSKPFKEGEKVIFTFDHGSTNTEWISKHELPIKQSVKDGKFRIVYNRSKKKVYLSVNNDKQELPDINRDESEEENEISEVGSIGNYFFNVLYAAGGFNSENFLSRLESSDPILREDARKDLAKTGEIAIPWIQKVLTDKKSSYQLKLGVIVALRNMKIKSPETLDPVLLNEMIEATMSQDKKIRYYSRRFFMRNACWNFSSLFRRALEEKRRLGNGSESVAYLAYAYFEMLYNLGIKEKDLADLKNKNGILKSIEAFSEAWGLREIGSKEDFIYFTKALYGWGLALHDKSMIDTFPDGNRRPQFVEDAKSKFKEFVQNVEKSNNLDKYKYKYKSHIKKANAYIKNPTAESLK